MFKNKHKNSDDELYNEVLLEHTNHPSHNGEMKNPDFTGTAENASCGDKITLMLKLDRNDEVLDASWTGEGCAIAKAAADILCCTILEENSDNVALDEVAENMPGRVKCVETAFNTLRDAPPSVLLAILSHPRV